MIRKKLSKKPLLSVTKEGVFLCVAVYPFLTELGIVQGAVKSFLRQQLLVVALLGYPAILQHQDKIGILYSG